MTDYSIDFLGTYLWLSILLCAIFLIITYLYYRKTTPPLSLLSKSILIVLRVTALIALFLVLTQPVLTITERYQKNKRAAVIIDCSNSMDQPVNINSDKTKRELVDEILTRNELVILFDSLDLEYYSFAESLDVTRTGINLNGGKTDFGTALNQLRKSTTLDRHDYIFLFSDGRGTDGENLADLARGFDRPIYTVAVGDSIEKNDIALNEVQYNNVIYAGRQTEIQAIISQQGQVSGSLQVRLLQGNQTLVQASAPPPGSGKTAEKSLTFTPAAPGKMILDLEITGDSGEQNRLNNRRKFAVRVLKSKVNVLLYSSSLNQEYAFLNRYLRGREDIEVVSVIDAAGGDRLGDRFPNTTEKLNSYDAVILIDPNLGRLSQHYDKFVSYLTDRGGGLFVLMGEEYAKSCSRSRIESLMPLAVSEAQINYGRYLMIPDPQMILHPAAKLGDSREEIENTWANQPPFASVVIVDSVRSTGVALAYAEGEYSRDRRCGFALRRMGAGKILASAVLPFWHWSFYPFGVGGDASVYQELFSSSIRWLTIGDETDRINFEPQSEVFQDGEEVIFSGAAHDEGFRPIENASGELIIVSASGDTTRARIIQDITKVGAYRSEAGILAPGEYSFRAELMAENVRLGRFEGRFAVDDIDRETAFADVNWTNLERAAVNSGGVFAPYSDLQPIIDAVDAYPTRVTETDDIRLWDHLVLLIIIIVSLSLEWFIRKSKQLL
ncbi:MAG: vWA domain-containing protein [candidate division Zixibacteria bacterium]